ncbi:MAG: peptidase MA family metallohydrolase, partial [Nitrospinota bacterium]
MISASLLLAALAPAARSAAELRDPYTGERAYQIAGEFFSLTVPEADLEFARKVLSWLEDARESLQKEFALPLKPAFQVRVTRLIPEEPPAVVGLYRPAEGAILVLSPRAWAFPLKQTRLKSTLGHEFVHAAVHQVLGDYYAFLPVWLNEGMAEHLGAYRRGTPWDVREHPAFLSAIHLRRLPSLEKLEEDFQERARAAVAYPAAKTLVEYILSRWGKDSAGKIITALRAERPGKDALERVFKSLYALSLEELEKDWQAAILKNYGSLAKANAHLQAAREHYQEGRWAEAAR